MRWISPKFQEHSVPLRVIESNGFTLTDKSINSNLSEIVIGHVLNYNKPSCLSHPAWERLCYKTSRLDWKFSSLIHIAVLLWNKIL